MTIKTLSITCPTANTPTPPPTPLLVDLVLTSVPNPNEGASLNEMLLVWQIYVGNPNNQHVELFPLHKLDNNEWQNITGPMGIPANYQFRWQGAGGYQRVYRGETHIVSIKSNNPTQPGGNWQEISRTIII